MTNLIRNQWFASFGEARRDVLAGVVVALAILIFMAQLPQLIGMSWHTYAMVAAGLGIIYLLPRITKAVRSPLVAIVVLAGVLLSGVFVAGKVQRMFAVERSETDAAVRYSVRGEIFVASVGRFALHDKTGFELGAVPQ